MSARLGLDAGELDARDEPDELLALADVVACACGGHAGDDGAMARVARAARAGGARLFAHPSYADREGFGRRSLAVAPGALAASVREQCARLRAVAEREGARVEGVKPHGALYHDAARDPALAAVVVQASLDALGPCAFVAPPGAAFGADARARGAEVLVEGFADRGYRPDGSLVPRGEPGALIASPADAAAQALRLARAGGFDLLSLHADAPGALARARAVRAVLPR